MVDQRIADRRREVRRERRRHRLRRTLLVVALLVLAVIAAMVERSSLVALAEVRVVGTERLDVDDVRAAADLPLGTSTLRLRLGPAEERVEALSLVRDATVHRLDPLTVEIRVTERIPAIVAVAGRREFLLDEGGVVLAPGAEDGLPVVELPAVTPLPALGATVGVDTALGNAVAAWAALPGTLRVEVGRYVASSADDLDLLLRDGTRVRFGRADRVAEKARALGAVLEDLGDTRVTTIDVRAPLAPVVVP